MEREKSMDDLLSFLYTVIDTLSLVFFLDAFATRRWDNWKFKLGVGCFVALLFWVLQVPFVFFGRDQAMKIGMILLSYTISARVLYKEISDKMLLLLVCIEYLVTHYLSFGLGMMGAFICGVDGESFQTSFPRAMVYGGINYSTELFLAYTFRRVMRKRSFSGRPNRLTGVRSWLYFLFPSTSFVMLVLLLYMTTGKNASEMVIAAACGLIFATNVAVLYLLERMEKMLKIRKEFWHWNNSFSFRLKIWKRQVSSTLLSDIRCTTFGHTLTRFKVFWKIRSTMRQNNI